MPEFVEKSERGYSQVKDRLIKLRRSGRVPYGWITDARRGGYFVETWHAERFREAGLDLQFVQDNQSRSLRGVLRGLHYQEPKPQGKLVRCSRGSLFDVAEPRTLQLTV